MNVQFTETSLLEWICAMGKKLGKRERRRIAEIQRKQKELRSNRISNLVDKATVVANAQKQAHKWYASYPHLKLLFDQLFRVFEEFSSLVTNVADLEFGKQTFNEQEIDSLCNLYHEYIKRFEDIKVLVKRFEASSLKTKGAESV